MPWKKLSSTSKNQSVNSFVVNYVNDQGYSFANFKEAYLMLGVGTLSGLFAKFINPIVALALTVAGLAYSAAAIKTMLEKNQESARIKTVLSDCYKYNGTTIQTVSELWEYTSSNGNATTAETRTNYYWF